MRIWIWWLLVSSVFALQSSKSNLDYNWYKYSAKIQNIEVVISPQFEVTIKQGTTLSLIIQYSPEERIPSPNSELESPIPTALPPYTTQAALVNMTFTWITEEGFLRSSDGFVSQKPGETKSKQVIIPPTLLKSDLCNSSTPDQKLIRVSYQDKRILISCHDSPFLYVHYAGQIKIMSLLGEPESNLVVRKYEGPVIDCIRKKKFEVRCLDLCHRALRGSAECRGNRRNRELILSYPKCVVRHCKIDTDRVKSQERAVPCGARRILGCKKGFLPEESKDLLCSESGWEPELKCHPTDQVCNRTYEESPRHGPTRWPTTIMNTTSIVQCRYGGEARRQCNASAQWENADWSSCYSALTVAIQSLVESRNLGNISDITGLLNMTKNASILAFQDIQNVFEYIELTEAESISKDYLILISNILSVDTEETKGVELSFISKILKTVVRAAHRFCSTQGFEEVKLPYLSLTCAGKLNGVVRESRLKIGKESGLFQSYRQKEQESEFIIILQGLGGNGTLNRILTTNAGAACAVVDIDSGVADTGKCTSDGKRCECFHRNGMVILLKKTGKTSGKLQYSFLRQVCHAVTITVIVLTILGLLCKGSLSDPFNAINLNIATAALVSQVVMLVLTLPLQKTENVNLNQTTTLPSLSRRSCVILNLISEYIHPALLSWSLASCLTLLSSLNTSTVLRSQHHWNMRVAKLAILIYSLPLLLPISHSVYCSVTTSDIEDCLMRGFNGSCWRGIYGVEDPVIYLHYLPITVLILLHLISLMVMLWRFYTSPDRSGLVESKSRLRMLLLCAIPLCALYALHCACAITSSDAELWIAFALSCAVFSISFSLSVIGSIRLSSSFVHFELHSGSRLKVSRTAL